MSSQSNEFQVTLPNNVKGNTRKTPVQYEPTLSKSLDFSEELDVALINLSYPHNWLVFDKPIQYLLMAPSTSNPILLKKHKRGLSFSCWTFTA